MNRSFTRLLCFFVLLVIPFQFISSAEKNKQTICLNMIVKNESHVILRCLESVLPIIDHWVIVDTGSTDGTQQIIRDFLHEIPGELYERPWVNFGHNRDEALQLALPTADYILFMDADDALIFDDNFVMPILTADSYMTPSFTAGDSMEYYFTRFVKSGLDWHWYDVIHEYVMAKDAKDPEYLEGIKYAYLSGGARSKDPQSYHRDIKLLKEGLQRDPTNTRYVFYLAQSYLCVGDLENALAAYTLRSECGGWFEEVFWSMLQIGRIQDSLGMDKETVMESLYDAYAYWPQRIEPLYYISAKARWEGDHAGAYAAAKLGLDTPMPKAGLFVEKWIYDFGLLFEYSISSYWVGQYRESLAACDKLLAIANLPDEYRKCTLSNRQFALQKVKMLDFVENIK